jgi:xanthine dehydrogenase accessory factor
MSIFEKIVELKKNNSAFTLVTIVKAKGSVPGKVGFKMIVESNGNIDGTVGGGAIEQTAIKQSLELLSSGENLMKEYILSEKYPKTKNEEIIIEMMCEGKVWIFYEVFGQKPTIYIFGGGHVGQALLYQLKPLGYNKILVDDREDINKLEHTNIADQLIITEDYEDFTAKFEPNPNCYYVVLTHGHKHDYGVLKKLIERKIKTNYIGLIASKAKAAGIKKQIAEEFRHVPDFSYVYSPIGLNIGGSTAEEIALAIAAQIQQIRYNI